MADYTLPDGCSQLTTYYMYLTAGCNMACRHCWIAPQFQATGGTGGHLDFELFKLAIEEALPLGLSTVKLTGGEPTLHPDFDRMLDHLIETKLGLVIETNGTLLTEERVAHIKSNPQLGFISVSLDGATAATHDAFRGVKGAFEKVCQSVRWLADAGLNPQVIMSIHPGNIDEMEDLVKLAQDMGAGSVKFNLVQPAGRGQKMVEREQVLTLKQLIDVGHWIEDDLQPRSTIALIYSWPPAFHSLRNLHSMANFTCAIKNIMGVLATGHLAMCGIGMEVPDLIYGKLGEDRVADVWASHPVLQAVRDDIPKNLTGICGDCIFRDRCKGLCPANNYLTGGEITSPMWFCTMAVEQNLFPATRRVSMPAETSVAV